MRRTNGVLRRPVTALLLTIALAAGCGESAEEANRPPRYFTSGTIFYAGEALSDAQVTYHPVASDGVPAFGRTDADGYYELTTYEASDGAVAGSYFVTVEKHDLPVITEEETSVSDEDYVPPEAATAADEPPRRLTPQRYSRAETTDLQADVSPDARNVFDFTLTD